MSQRPTLREQIDACRADSDDLHLPEHAADLAELQAGLQQSAEIRALWEHLQFDERVIRGAIQDVPVPAGLEQRLLAAVQAAQVQPLACVEKATAEETPAQGVVSAASAERAPATSRRRWVWSTLGLTAAAALILAAVVGNQFLNPIDEAISKDQLAAQVQGWLQASDPLKMKWDATTEKKRFPSESLHGVVDHSGSVTSSEGTITVYDVKLAGSRALLLVLPTTANYPVDSLPFTSVSVSGAWDVVAWQKGGVLYVLAVRGDARLEQFIRRQRIG